MKRSVITMLLFIAMLSTATTSQAGWYRDAGHSIGHVSRHSADYSRHAYHRAGSTLTIMNENGGKGAHETYRNSNRAVREAREGYREGYREGIRQEVRETYHRRDR